MNHPRRRRAFTIVELLMSIAIIFVLLGMAFYALKLVRRSASRTESLNALRQMVAAHEAYTQNHKDRFMPGFIAPNDFGPGEAFENMKVRLPNGTDLPAVAKASYVWRLAPYLDNVWRTYMLDYESQSFESRLNDEYDTGTYGVDPMVAGPPYGIATRPSFGLNSIFIGGDSMHGGVGSLAPWKVAANVSPIAATRPSQVKRPPKLIVFGPTVRYPQATVEVKIGYAELRPPFAGYNPSTGATSEPQWSLDTNTMQFTLSPGVEPCGVPFDRRSSQRHDHIPFAFQDGSVGTQNILSIYNDMSFWSPFAVSQR